MDNIIQNSRILGLDVGDKTIGIAVSDPFNIFAQSLKTIRRSSILKDIEEVETLINDYNVDLLVVGLPKNMNNTMGPQSTKVLKFMEKLENKINIDVKYIDERLTTVSAEKMLLENNVSRANRKKVIDAAAAAYILQQYIDIERNQKK